jgi:hypothetical protein
MTTATSIWVDTLANAKTLTWSSGPIDGQILVVDCRARSGSSVANDGYSGSFFYDATDSTSTFAQDALGFVDTSNRRWKRLYSGALNAKWYGAVGDNSTDDTTAIQAALTDISNMAGNELFLPLGVYKITSGLTVAPGDDGFTLTGVGRRLSMLASSLTSGTMLTVGDSVTFNATEGVLLQNVGFTSNMLPGGASGEAQLVNLDFCLDGRVRNCAFDGGFDTQLFVGAPQGTEITGSEFKGYYNGHGSTDRANYGTSCGIRLGVSANGHGGQGARIHHSTIRDFRNATGTAIAIDISQGATVGGSFVSTGQEFMVDHNEAIENSDTLIAVECWRCTVCGNEMETSFGAGDTTPADTLVRVGKIVGGGNIIARSFHAYENTMSSDNIAGILHFDMQSYRQAVLRGNVFIEVASMSTAVNWGSDCGNWRSEFFANDGIDCRTQIDRTSGVVDGKWKCIDNMDFSTTPGLYTAVAGDTTPSVANVETLLTANTSATTITKFSNGFTGHDFVLWVNDANTTVSHNSTIRLIAGANTHFASGTRLLFRASQNNGPTQVPVYYEVAQLPA